MLLCAWTGCLRCALIGILCDDTDWSGKEMASMVAQRLENSLHAAATGSNICIPPR